MKKITTFLFSIIVIASSAAQTAPKGLASLWRPDPSQMGGLSTNDYLTNFTFVYYSTQNVNTPTNQWPVLSIVSATFFAPNIIAGIEFTNLLTLPITSDFFLMQCSNYNGTVSPFSNPAAWVGPGPAGTLRIVR